MHLLVNLVAEVTGDSRSPLRETKITMSRSHRKYRSIDGTTCSSGKGSTISSRKMRKNPRNGDQLVPEQNHSPGIELMGFVFFGSDDSEATGPPTQEGTALNISKTKKNKTERRMLFQKKSKDDQFANDNDSVGTNNTSATDLYRYLFGNEDGLLVSGPANVVDQTLETASLPSMTNERRGWWKGKGIRLNKSRKNHDIPDMVYPTTTLPKQRQYVAPGTIFVLENRDEEVVQRFKAVEEKSRREIHARSKSWDDEWSILGDIPMDDRHEVPVTVEGASKPTNGMDMATWEKSKSCMKWPGSVQGVEPEAEILQTQNEKDADLFLQILPPPEQHKIEKQKYLTKKNDILARMDSFEADIHQANPKSCALWPKPQKGAGWAKTKEKGEDLDLVTKTDSFTDLIRERREKKCFPRWPDGDVSHPAVDATVESTDRAFEDFGILIVDEDSLAENNPNRKGCWPRPKDSAYYSSLSTDISAIDSLRIDTAQGSKRCLPVWPKRESYMGIIGDGFSEYTEDRTDVESDRYVEDREEYQLKQGFASGSPWKVLDARDDRSFREQPSQASSWKSLDSIPYLYRFEHQVSSEESRSYASSWFSLDSMLPE